MWQVDLQRGDSPNEHKDLSHYFSDEDMPPERPNRDEFRLAMRRLGRELSIHVDMDEVTVTPCGQGATYVPVEGDWLRPKGERRHRGIGGLLSSLICS